jgi:hypothetical protein
MERAFRAPKPPGTPLVRFNGPRETECGEQGATTNMKAERPPGEPARSASVTAT